MKAYYYDNLPGDQRLPHISSTSNSTTIPSTHLSQLGVETCHHPSLNSVDDLASSRGYKHRDEITISPEAMGSSETYHTKLQIFFQEHMHEDEEIRYILDGTGFFDVRGEDEKWVRIQVEKGDLIVLPAGIWHRFTTDMGDYIKAMRLFKDEPKWTPLNRSEEMEKNPFRMEYLRSRSQTAGGA